MSGPRVSVVLASRRGMAESRPMLEYLAGQTIAREMEVILVAPRGVVREDALQAVPGFESVSLVETGRPESRGVAAAHGVLVARAPFVALCENHCFPTQDTYEKLISDRTPDDAAVAATIRSANPETRRSLAMYLAAYGHAAAPVDPSPRDSLPYHNVVYRADLLQSLGAQLPRLMEDEGRLHGHLRKQGFRLRIRPDAVNWHTNEARWSRALVDPFVLGLKFGTSRGAPWPVWKRMVYPAAFPAILLLRLRGLLRTARMAEDTRTQVWGLLPLLVGFAALGAAGEVWGCLFPATPVPADFEDHEFHVRGRLGGVTPRSPWLASIAAGLPSDLA